MKLKKLYARFRAWQRHPFHYVNKSQGTVRCANCGMEFADNFCPRCGQRAGVGRIGWTSVRRGVMILWGMDSRSMGFSILQLLLRPGFFIGDYISGRQQISFPPVKMLFIVSMFYLLVDKLLVGHEEPVDVENLPEILAQFKEWYSNNVGWGILLLTSLLIPPTWSLFRYAPKHRKHSLPEGFFIQVFLGVLILLLEIIGRFISVFGSMLIPFYCIVTYHQLFGYGWWCTIWRAALTFFAAFLTGAALMFVVFVAFFDHKPGIDWMAVKFAVFLLIVYVLVLSIGFLIGWARNDKVLSMRKA